MTNRSSLIQEPAFQVLLWTANPVLSDLLRDALGKCAIDSHSYAATEYAELLDFTVNNYEHHLVFKVLLWGKGALDIARLLPDTISFIAIQNDMILSRRNGSIFWERAMFGPIRALLAIIGA